MPDTDRISDGFEELRYRLDGFLQPGESIHRHTLFDAIASFIPKDPELSVQVYSYEIVPGGFTPWHIHGGATFYLTLQGRFEGHFEEGVLIRGGPGEVYSEPMGRPHRGHNPHPTLPLLGIGIALTSPHIPALIPVEEPAWAREPRP
jgi:quercetin dioxygenase-like cupin family protein